MRGLVVGLGSIGRRHARNWAALRLGPLAVCHQARAPAPQPEPLGVEAREYYSLSPALETEQPDVVLVTNPTSLHVETACMAVRAGAHVFIEKPLGHQLIGIADLLQTAKQQRRQLMVGYQLRFHPGLQRLRRLVDDNAIGRVVTARAEAGEYLPDWHPWEDYRISYSGRRELGGGAVLTLSHELDALCWLLGAPRRLSSVAGHASSLEIDTEDVAELILQFAGGQTASVHVDYVRRPPRRILELVGEDGVLRWDYDANRLYQYLPATRQWRVEDGDPRFERNQMYLAELQHFARCMRGEVESPVVGGEQAAAVLVISLAALRSSETGQTIDLDAEAEPVGSWLSSLGRGH
jgi:predicted dehydrogenase